MEKAFEKIRELAEQGKIVHIKTTSKSYSIAIEKDTLVNRSGIIISFQTSLSAVHYNDESLIDNTQLNVYRQRVELCDSCIENVYEEKNEVLMSIEKILKENNFVFSRHPISNQPYKCAGALNAESFYCARLRNVLGHMIGKKNIYIKKVDSENETITCCEFSEIEKVNNICKFNIYLVNKQTEETLPFRDCCNYSWELQRDDASNYCRTIRALLKIGTSDKKLIIRKQLDAFINSLILQK